MARLPAAEVVGTEAAVTVPQVILDPTEPTFPAITRQIRTAPSSTITRPKEMSIRGPENPARSRRTGAARVLFIVMAIMGGLGRMRLSRQLSGFPHGLAHIRQALRSICPRLP